MADGATAVSAAASGAPRDAAIREGSKSFALASRLFDSATRDLVWDLYAWCRHCDDVVDGQVLGHSADRSRAATATALRAFEALRSHTDDVFSSRAVSEPAFAALGRVVAATRLPRRFADDHLAGFAMDVDGRRYVTLDDTLAYCYHVAGVVGLMMAWVMGVRDRAVLCRASDLGLAFQLSNLARDVGDDLLAGRIYLPSAWLEHAGASLVPGHTLERDAAARVAPVVARLLAEAERYYDSAWHGVPHLPGRSAWAVATARLVYRDIGRRVAHRGAHAWTSRTVVTNPVKVMRLAQAGLATAWVKTAGPPQRTVARVGLYTPAAIDVVG